MTLAATPDASIWRSRRVAWVLIQATVAGVLAWLCLRRVNPGEVAGVLSGADGGLLALSTACLLARLPLSGYRWKLLLDPGGQQFSTGFLTAVNIVSHFFVTLLPGGAGADLARGFYLFRLGVAPPRILGSLMADRVFGVAGLVAMSVPPACWVAWYRPDLWPVPATVAGLIALGCGAAWLWSRRLMPARIRERLEPWTVQIGPRTSVTLLALSITFHAGGVVAAYLAGRALGDHTPAHYYALFMPLIWLWTSLPVSLYGIGLREGAFLFYFGLLGVPRELAIAMSVVLLSQSILQALLGGMLMVIVRPASGAPNG